MSTDRPRTIRRPGALRELPRVVAAEGITRPFVVTTSGTIERLALRDLLEDATFFSGFRPNPTIEDVLSAVASFRAGAYDGVVGIGGGSAMDVAKCARALRPPPESSPERALGAVAAPGEPLVPLVQVPTTGGSGSESTQFAVTYVDGMKRSVDDAALATDVAVVDPDLLATCSPDLAYAGAFDALCHAVESYWSRRATPESRRLALAALSGVVPALDAGLDVGDATVRARLAEAAHVAGRAINRTRTTSAHAFAYPLTTGYGVPHGLACAVNLHWLLPLHAETCGPQLEEMWQLFGGSPAEAVERLDVWLAGAGQSPSLRTYGIAANDLPDLARAGLASDRAANSPVELDVATVTRHLAAAW